MSVSIDISSLLSYLRSTSNLALSCVGFHRLVKSNGFPIRSSKGELHPGNLSFYKLLDYPNLDEWTINEFSKAIKTDDSDRLKLLLDKGANIEAKNDIGRTTLMTALHFAAWRGEIKCLQLLLEYNANVEAKDGYGYTALVYATAWNETECLKLLLRGGAKVEPWLRQKYPDADLWPDSTL